MSKIIKIQSLKNGSSVIKIKTVANEKYIIADETGKPLNKLKFVQKDKNLEVYQEVDGKEQQIVTFENYYAENMNASVVGLDETSEELAYVYNANDGWSYLELEDTAFGFAAPLLGLGATGVAGAGVAIANSGGDGTDNSTPASDTTPPVAPTTAISNYDDNAGAITNATSTATTTDDTTPGFNVGAIPADANSIVLYVDGVEVAATYDSVNETLTPNTPLAEGTYDITYAYKDANGNTSTQSPAFSLTVDTPPIAPTTAISSYDDNAGAITNANSTATTTDDTTPGFNVGAIPSDANSIVLYVDGVEVPATYNVATGTLTPNTPLTDGTYDITYAYKDATGNTSAQSPAFSLTIDTPPAAPATAITNYDDNAGAITNATSTATSTDDTTPGFNVGAIPSDASSIVLYVDGVEVPATYNSTTGTLTPNTPLSEGTYDITYAYEDASGNTSAQSPAFSLTIDTPPIAPTTAISSYDDNAGAVTNATSTATSTDDSTPGFNVGAIPSDANSIVLYVDGVEVPATYNVATGTLTPNTPLTDGTYDITYAYKDAAGNTSTQSPAFTLTIDTPPIAPTTAISNYNDNAGAITNATSTATTTDDTTPGFNVGAIPADASSIILYVDGVEVPATYNSTTGTLTPNTPLSEGTYDITYAYEDASGNTSAQSPAFSLTIDTPPIAPTTAISNYNDNAGAITNATSTATTTDDTTPGFNVGAIPSDASSIVLYVDGVEVPATYNSTTGTLTPNTPLSEGTYDITYAYEDASGNTSAQSPAFSLTIDTPPIAPTTAISSYDDNAGAVTNATSTATSTDDSTPGFNVGAIPSDANSIVLYVDGVEVPATYNVATGTLTPNTPLTDGTYDITYAYKDAAGNTSTQSPAFTLTIDTPPIAPTTAISNYNDNAGAITNATSTATTTDDTTPGFNVGAIPADASSIILYVDGVEVPATYNSTTGTLTPNTPLTEGTHSITYAYEDASGNTSAQSPAFSLTIDTPPIAPTTAISSYDDNAGAVTNATSTATSTDDSTPGFNVGAIPSDANSIVLYVDGVEVPATYNVATGTLTPNTPLTDGTYDITYAYKDAAGNTSTQSPAFTLTIDTPPIAPTTAISNYNDNAGAITNATSTATTTDDTTPGFNVGAIPADASSIILYVDGVEVPATYNSTTGTLTPNTPLSEGTYDITYAYEDASGNTSAQSPAFSLTIDTPPIAPTTAISSYDDNAGAVTNATSTATSTDDSTPGFNVGAIPSDASSIVLYVDGVVVPATYVNGVLTPNTPLGEGTHSITYAYKDASGNTSAQSPAFSLTVDAIPTATVALDKTALKIGETATLTITFSEVPSNFVEADDLTLENGTLSGGSFDITGKIYTATFTPTANIEDSTNVITLGTSWSDSSNNAPASTSVSGNVAIDTIAPPALSLKLNTDSGASNIDGYTNNGLIDVTGIEVGNTWKYSIDGGNTWIDGVGSSFTLPADTYGINDIQVKQIDASGNEVITSEVKGNAQLIKLEPIGVTNGDDNRPQITTLSDGSYVVTWFGADTDGDNSVFVQKFNSDGTTQGTQVKLERAGVTNENDERPQVTALDNGEFAVTYLSGDWMSGSIIVQKFDSTGATQGASVELSGLGGMTDAPQITTLATGEYVVTYSSRSSDRMNQSVFIQKFDSTGTALGTQIQLNGASSSDNSSPQIVSVGNTGEYIVTWSGDGDIYVQKFNADGTTTGNSMITLDGLNRQDFEPDITVLDNQEFVVMWEGYDSSWNTHLFVQKFNADGTTLGNPEVIVGSQANYDKAQITPLPNGEFVVTYTGGISDTSIIVQKFNVDGTTTGNSAVILEGVVGTSDERPQITTLSDGSYVVTWWGTQNDGTHTIQAQKFNNDGTTTGHSMITLDGVPGLYDEEPQITALNNGGFVVTWSGNDENSDWSIFVQQFDANGLPIKVTYTNITVDTGIPNTPIIDTIATDDIVNASEQSSAITGTCEAGAIVSLSIGGNTKLATVTGTTWSYTLSGADITAMGQGAETITATQTDKAGNTSVVPASKNITVDTTAPDFSIINMLSPQVKLEATGVINGWDADSQITAVGTAGEYVITYRGVDSNGDASIFVQKFNADGTIQGSQVMLEATDVTNGSDYSPQITAVGTAGEYVVTYQGTDINGDQSIFVQKFNSDGTIQGSQVILEATGITTGTDNASQVTALNNGEYVVTYYGADSNGDYSIFVQKFNADGTIQGSQVMLEATDVTNGSDYSPQITAVGTAGEYVVTFPGRDSNGDDSIFVQKFNADGTIQGSQVKLEGTGVINGNDYYPQITAVGTAGEYVVTYYGIDSNGDNSIFVQKFNADGTIQGSQVKLEGTGVINGNDYYPQITAVGTAGEYVVTFPGRDSNGDDSIFVQKFNADGTIQGSQVKLEGTGVINGNDYYPQITAVGTAGEYVVTYYGIDSNGDYSIFVQKFNADGTIQGSQVMLEATDVTNGSDYSPQITAVGTAGEYVVTFPGRDSNGDYSIFVQKFNADGTPANLVEAVTVAENTANTTVIYDANATDNGGANDVGITYSIIGGADASKFTIDPATGEVRFITSPDYENPTDVGGNNVYDIIIKATDSAGNSLNKNLAITVTDVALAPVVIDLDGDGDISYIQKIMDVNSDGILDKTAWVDENDGVLIWDKYQDGKVHDSSQYELSQYGGNTDLEGLAAGFDSNYDGVFDQKDEKFAQFAIWQDLNNNGMSQDGEVKTLADWGINSINLTSDGITRTDEAGVIEAGRTIATKTDGSEVVIGDAGFEYTTAQDDSIFASLQIWVDTNVDGKTNSGELYKLEDLNVKSLDLNSQNTSSIDNGNIQGLVSNWTDTNDNSHEMVDVWFKTQEVSQNTISETSAWTTSTVSEVNNQSYAVYANTQIVIEEESKTQNII